MGIKFWIPVVAAAGLALLIAESSAGPVEDAEARQSTALAIQQEATIAFNNKRREITQKNTPATNQDLAELAALQNAMDAAVQNVQAANKGVMDAQQSVWQQQRPTTNAGSTPATTSSPPLTTTTSSSPGGTASPARVTTAPGGGQQQSGLSIGDALDILPNAYDLLLPDSRGLHPPSPFDGVRANAPGGGQPQSGLSNSDVFDILPGANDLFFPRLAQHVAHAGCL